MTHSRPLLKIACYGLLFITIISCSRTGIQTSAEELPPVSFHLDLTSITNDTFTVEITPPRLDRSNNIFQFAATAPGTYQVMNIGRFVSDFRAFDAEGRALPVVRTGINQVQFTRPEEVRKITYRIAETWDTPVPSFPIYPMCGTSIEADHILINAHAVLGYFAGMQARPIDLFLEYFDSWQLGTALPQPEKGHFRAQSYDHLIDSPIMMGRLTKANTEVRETQVEVYTYSKTGMINSLDILTSLEGMLHAAAKFLDGLPVDRYTFLFHFEDAEAGAWEHSYSSGYVYPELPWSDLQDRILAVASHEFFHIVTPLNIHSEVINQFNFVTPQPSDHLWFYEGVTEWASEMILLQGKEIGLERYFGQLQQKLSVDEFVYDQSVSLRELARTSFTEEGHRQFSNIYARGAIVGALLDLKLLKLSNGEQSLRKLIVELTKAYGPDRPFSEKKFYRDLANRTFPEVEDFLDRYVSKAKPLPVEEYFSWIGVDYEPLVVDSSSASFGMLFYPTSTGLYVMSTPVGPGVQNFQRRDYIQAIDGQPVNANNYESIREKFAAMAPGTSYGADIIRGGQALRITGKLQVKTDRHVFTVNPNPTPEQLLLREHWLRMHDHPDIDCKHLH